MSVVTSQPDRLGPSFQEVDLSIRTRPRRQAGFMVAVISAVDQAERVES